MIPGTVFMSLLAGALFGVFKGVALVVFTATAGASSCYFLSKMIGRPILSSLWPEKLKFFQTQVCFNFPPHWFWSNLHMEHKKLFVWIHRWLEEERVCWITCFFWDWLQPYPTHLLILHHLLWMCRIISSSWQLLLDWFLLLMSLLRYVAYQNCYLYNKYYNS